MYICNTHTHTYYNNMGRCYYNTKFNKVCLVEEKCYYGNIQIFKLRFISNIRGTSLYFVRAACIYVVSFSSSLEHKLSDFLYRVEEKEIGKKSERYEIDMLEY